MMPCWTHYEDVDRVLSLLLENLRTNLADRFAGLYVHGSLALGDFTPGRSDIDILVVTNGDLPADTISQMKRMHAALASSGVMWADLLEGPYITL